MSIPHPLANPFQCRDKRREASRITIAPGSVPVRGVQSGIPPLSPASSTSPDGERRAAHPGVLPTQPDSGTGAERRRKDSRCH